MVSIEDFRQFIHFVNERFSQLAERYEELKLITTDILKRAEEIERKSVGGDAQMRMQTDEEEVISSCEPTELIVRQNEKVQKKVKRRKKRVRQKIDQHVSTTN